MRQFGGLQVLVQSMDLDLNLLQVILLVERTPMLELNKWTHFHPDLWPNLIPKSLGEAQIYLT